MSMSPEALAKSHTAALRTVAYWQFLKEGGR